MSGLNATWKIIALQAICTCVVAAICYQWQGANALPAVLFGGGLAIVHAWMLGRRVRLATEAARRAPGSETTVLYIGAIQRFVATLIGFGMGMGLLKLAPVPLLIAFAAAQGVFLMSKSVSSVMTSSAHGDPKGG